MIALRSLLFNILFYANLIVLMILGLPSVFLGRHAVFFMARSWGASSLWLLRMICGLTIEFRGLEHIPRGGYIIAAKHQSFLETFALLRHAPDFAYVLKRELTYIPFFGWYLIGAEQIGIDRGSGRNALAQLSRRAGAVLRAGRQIFIFPEGTRRPPGRPRNTSSASPSSMRTQERPVCRSPSTPACSGAGADSPAAPASPSSNISR